MITCELKVQDNIDDLYRIFMSEKLDSDRANCKIKKNKNLVFEITAKDPVSMKAFLNSILKIINVYQKTKDIK